MRARRSKRPPGPGTYGRPGAARARPPGPTPSAARASAPRRGRDRPWPRPRRRPPGRWSAGLSRASRRACPTTIMPLARNHSVRTASECGDRALRTSTTAAATLPASGCSPRSRPPLLQVRHEPLRGRAHSGAVGRRADHDAVGGEQPAGAAPEPVHRRAGAAQVAPVPAFAAHVSSRWSDCARGAPARPRRPRSRGPRARARGARRCCRPGSRSRRRGGPSAARPRRSQAPRERQAFSFLSAHAMWRPRVAMVAMPSSSCSTSPLPRPMPRFQ